MKNMTLENIARACGGELLCAEKERTVCAADITTDSRKVTPGCLFAAIKGGRFDGHDFLARSVEDGACAVLCERAPEDADFPRIIVPSTPEALQKIAAFYLEQMAVPVVGIAGSVGKTSTKEMIASVLSTRFSVLKTEGNFNNELCLPLTVFRLRDEHEIAVLEMGISDFGEMHTLASIAKPQTCVITNIGWCHLEFLKDRAGILRAKSEIFDFLEKDGRIILNGDDDMLNTVRCVKGITPVRYGLGSGCSFRADHIEPLGFEGTRFEMHMPARFDAPDEASESVTAVLPAPGAHMVSNALAAAAVGRAFGLSAEEIRRGIEAYRPVSGRFRVSRTGSYTVIDDCYNANPVSMKASLQTLQSASGRKVAVLGDMGELGEEEKELHRGVGEFAGSLAIDMICCAGELMRSLYDGVRMTDPAMEIHWFPDRVSLTESLPSLLKENDTVLVKASHFMEFEKIVEMLENMTA